MIKNNIIFLMLLTFVLVFLFSFKFDVKDNNLPKEEAYNLYKKSCMTENGNIIDYSKKNITTSEGQAYIMLLSLIFDDEKTFKLAYNWSKKNLQRQDKLFSWLWGKNPSGEYVVLDENSASDADVDIAFSLIVASKKWHNSNYQKDAKEIMNAIWQHETKMIAGHLVLMPGALQNTSETNLEVNPSYFAPYAFRAFNNCDDAHDWNMLVDSSYYYLNQVLSKTQTHLPPDWFFIQNGKIVLENSERSDFSYDAVRVFTRIYYDFVLSGDKRALQVLNNSKIFITEWEKSKSFYTNYKSDGKLRDKSQFIGAIAAVLPVIAYYDKDAAYEIYEKKLSQKFNDKNYWQAKNDYYAKNLSLFGWFLYDKNSKEYKEMQRLKLVKK